MNLFLRLVRVFLHAFFRPKVDFFEKTQVHFRVWVNDLDINMHMTNSRYLSVMDLGRTDLLIRAGLASHFWHHKWQAVLGAANLRFRRGLTFFQRYTLHTQVVGWDEKWFYIQQEITCRNQLIASGIVKGVFVGPHGTVPIQTVFKTVGLDKPLQQLTPFIQSWHAMDEASRQEKELNA